MAATLSVVPLYVKSKLEVLVGENSLLSRALNIPRSFVNMMTLIPSRIFLSSDNNDGYTTWIWTRYWRYGWSLVTTKEVLKKTDEEESEVEALRDCSSSATQKMSSSAGITRLYFYILDNNFFGVTRDSLELLRHESKVLKGLQDFELFTTLKSLFGCLPDENDVDKTELKTFSSVKELFWKASIFTWRTLFSRLFQSSVISWVLPVSKFSDEKEKTTTPTNQIPVKEEDCHPSSHTMTPCAGSLLMCESSLLPTIVSDSGTYALSATHDLLKEAVLLFVPMELLENTTELLTNPSLAMSVSPMSAFWQLFNYVSIWGLDIMDEVCNQQEINYAVIDDDDFHFVVNVPRMRRPIMFIGIR